MMGEHDDEEMYCIEYVDDSMCGGGVMPDGGHVDPLVETRERLVRVEATQEKIRSAVERVEEKVDETNELVQEVEDTSLSKGRFEREYEDIIESGRTYIIAGKWLSLLLLVVVALLELLGALGYQPL